MRSVRVPTIDDVRAAEDLVRSALTPTPVVPSPRLGDGVVLKLESFQPTGSFKVRGALAAVAAALRDDPEGRIVTASAGNHGLGVAFASGRLGARATVVVPVTASPVKVAALERFPIDLVCHGDSYDESEVHALALATDTGARFVSPYNDTFVIAGQGSIVGELLSQRPEVRAIVTPVGGGGLASGIGLAASAVSGGLHIVGVEADQSPAFRHAVPARRPVPFEPGPTLADGLGGNLEKGSVTVELIADNVAELAAVTEAEIEDAIRFAAREHGLVIEGAAAVGIAALLAGRVAPATDGMTAVVVTGRNIAPDKLAAVLDR
jgi:threonine dehydratase